MTTVKLDKTTSLYDRNGLWYIRTRQGTRIIRRSLDTDNLREAKRRAVTFVDQQSSRDVSSIPDLVQEALSATGIPASKQQWTRLDRFLRLYVLYHWRNQSLVNLNTFSVERFWLWRETAWQAAEFREHAQQQGFATGRKQAKASTIHQEAQLLNRFFEFAREQHQLWSFKMPATTPPQKSVRRRRGSFSMQEWERLRDELQKRAAPVNGIVTREWVALWALVSLLINTGMRPGEAMNLRFQDVSLIQQGNRSYTVFRVQGKTGSRELVSHADTYEIARAWGRFNSSDYVFRDALARPDRLFHEVLDHLNMKRDHAGDERSLYSLRHTYATFQRRYRNASYEDLARNMGTSAEMLKAHYDHIAVADVAERLTEDTWV